ncbi:BRO-N domain-containing protein [Acinetobacter bereziniae]|uniref:BRO-N domain-containing protein n=1 Tax=Acinetobacter bereziniae TaxID=106648 RepID=UPI0015D9BE20|nr:BRO family protein [Acinetobacter bereziniae]
MTSLTLSFNDVNFSPVQQDGQIWLTASELAKALGYAKSDAISQVYERNKDEFTSSMTLTLKLSVNGINNSKRGKETRIFSLRGAHLIAMFSKTAIAKQFRKWVLDILDREVFNQQVDSKQYISAEQCGILYNIVHTRAGGNQGLIKQMWSRLKNHFKYSASYRELRAIHFDDAKHYLEMMDLNAKTEKPQDNDALEKLQSFVENLAHHYPTLQNPIAHEIAEKFCDFLKYQNTNDERLVYYVLISKGKVSVIPQTIHHVPVDIVELSEAFKPLYEYMMGYEISRQAGHLKKLELKNVPR